MFQSELPEERPQTHLFPRATPKRNHRFSRGETPSRPLPKTEGLQVPFFLRGIVWGCQEEGEGWGGQGERKAKKMRKKRGGKVSQRALTLEGSHKDKSAWDLGRGRENYRSLFLFFEARLRLAPTFPTPPAPRPLF